MFFLKKLFRILCELLTNKYQVVFIFVVIVLVFYFSHVGEMLNNYDYNEKNYYDFCDDKIDIVYTWVNGTDPKFKNDLKKYLNENIYNINDYSQERFDDKYELKFSLRALEQYAPWIHHVYIVTNGQIPYWLNLDYEKVSIVTHEQIFPNLDDLPTFSSPAIESNIHRIPGLSERFIYFNDDIFLGAPVYPDDFYSQNRGYLVYLAWPLPSCVPNCPWVYVGDGQCDSSCFNANCQFDGGDCDASENRANSHDFNHHDFDDDLKNDLDYEYYEEDRKHHFAKRETIKTNKNNSIANKNNNNTNNTTEHYKIFNKSVTISTRVKPNKKPSLLGNNLSLLGNHTNTAKLLDIINQHNQKILHNDKLKRKKRLFKSLRKRKLDYKTVFNHSGNNLTLNSSANINRNNHLDTFALSLQHTNRVFNIVYGFKLRKVPAHAPILINKKVMNDLQLKFWREIRNTQKNRFRSPNDMQFSFTYYYYLINEKMTVNMSEIFDRFDTDSSGTWSDREIRTILTKINDLPLNYGMVETFDNAIVNCSKHFRMSDVVVPPYERYIDSKLPTVSKELILNCPEIINMLNDNFQLKDKYLYEIIKNAQGHYVLFKMLTSNISDVVGHLDEIRKEPRKFICLNDNMNPTKIEENDLVKAILLDFYISLFPKPSKFELLQEYRNRFSYVSELKNWKTYHTKLKIFLLFCVLILLGICFHNICKRRLLRQVKRIIYF